MFEIVQFLFLQLFFSDVAMESLSCTGDGYAALMPNKSSEEEKDLQSSPELPFNLVDEGQNN